MKRGRGKRIFFGSRGGEPFTDSRQIKRKQDSAYY